MVVSTAPACLMHRALHDAEPSSHHRLVSQPICSSLPSPGCTRPTAYSSIVPTTVLLHRWQSRSSLTDAYAAVAPQLQTSNSNHLPLVASPQLTAALIPTTRRVGSAAVGTANRTLATATDTAVLGEAVAMDVEYSHLMLKDGQKVAAPAWVALVDGDCKLLLKTYIRPEVLNIKCSYGGVPYDLCISAPTLTQEQQQLLPLLAHKTLIGHGLAKDLAALQIQHPQGLRYDTITYPGFCNRAGNARSLRQLAKDFLGLKIQQKPRQLQQQPQQQVQQKTQQSSNTKPDRKPGGVARRGQQQQQQQQHVIQRLQHDPEEDANAVMKLYKQIVLPNTYEGQVAATTNQLIQEIQKRQQQLALQEDFSVDSLYE